MDQADSAIVSAEEVARCRDQLLRYARSRLRNPAHAEDAVQDALVAALAAGGSFHGRAALGTWLTGILKHKIIDAIRRTSRERERFVDTSGNDDGTDALFLESGHWVEHPPAWENPDACLEQKKFFAALEACLAKLPAKISQAFMMREHLGLDTDEICKELAVTPTYCGVLLYRARMALQECLDKSWFGRT